MEIPTVLDFKIAIDEILKASAQKGDSFVDIKSGNLHRQIGGYPGPNHRMPTCCKAMRDSMVGGDILLYEPTKGQGATLEIRYKLPR